MRVGVRVHVRVAECTAVASPSPGGWWLVEAVRVSYISVSSSAPAPVEPRRHPRPLSLCWAPWELREK